MFNACFFKKGKNRESVFSSLFISVNVLYVTPKGEDIAEIYFGSVNGTPLYRVQ
jgi:hypothetical protein